MIDIFEKFFQNKMFIVMNIPNNEILETSIDSLKIFTNKNIYFFKIKLEFWKAFKSLYNEKPRKIDFLSHDSKNFQKRNNITKENLSQFLAFNLKENNNELDNIIKLNNFDNPHESGSLFNSILVNKNSQFLEEVLDKIQHKKTMRNFSIDFETLSNSNSKEITIKSILKKKKSSKRNIINRHKTINFITNHDEEEICMTNNTKNKELSINYSKIIQNNCWAKFYDKKDNSEDDIRRCSSIKINNNISNSEFSLMKEIKDIDVEIDNKNRRINNFLENKQNLKKIIDENMINNTHSQNIDEIRCLHDQKNSDFNINDLNLNLSKLSDLKVCKNVNLSLLENSVISVIKKDSIEQISHEPNKNILNNQINNNELFVITTTNSKKESKVNNESYSSHKSNRNEFTPPVQSQNFWFSIDNSISKSSSEKRNFPKESNNHSFEKNEITKKNSKLLEKNNNSLGSIYNYGIAVNNEFNFTAEKVKEFSLISIKMKSEKSNNSIISKNSFDSLDKKSSRKYNDNNYIMANDANYSKMIDKKHNYLKISKNSNCKNSLSKENHLWEKKNNIMKIRKNRRSINKKKEGKQLIKLKDFEEILIEANNKSFEEKTENCSVWNKFFGFFNVFKCGGNTPN